MQGNNDHLINSGSITATGAASDAVFSNTAGSNFTALIENRAGGRIVAQGAIGIRTLNGNTTIVNAGLVQSGIGSAIAMGNGNDSLILQTGSTIIGSADGGAGGNTVTLQGAGTGGQRVHPLPDAADARHAVELDRQRIVRVGARAGRHAESDRHTGRAGVGRGDGQCWAQRCRPMRKICRKASSTTVLCVSLSRSTAATRG